MTSVQIKKATELAGTMDRNDIAKKLGVSLSNLKRSCPGVRFTYFNQHANNPNRTRDICLYYAKHGRPATEKKFPGVKVRSVVEKYFKGQLSRQRPWTDSQMAELVRMGGLVSKEAQAKYFKRPRANAGSIESAWIKKIGTKMSRIHYMPDYHAKYFVTDQCPRLQFKFWSRRLKTKKSNKRVEKINAVLWCDFAKHLRPDCPEFIRDAAGALAEFQKWIFKSKNPKRVILKMVREREI